MALSLTYVDPSINANSGAGTVGDPYGDLQHALNTMSRDGTNGDRINIKAGTAEVLTAALVLTTYGTPTEPAPLVFQGYTTAAEDGGQGSISGGGSFTMLASSAIDFVFFCDLELHNTGSADIVNMDNQGGVINCELHTSSGDAIDIDTDGLVENCYIHGISGNYGIFGLGSRVVNNRVVSDATDTLTACIRNSGPIEHNICKVEGATIGIEAQEDASIVKNGVYSAGGTGTGISCPSNLRIQDLRSNVVEGFSGTGGVGFDVQGPVVYYDGNAAYNNTTNYAGGTNGPLYAQNDNETLSSSPWTDAANDDFTPVDTGNMKEGARPAKVGVL